jgi:hypothetical protein
MICADLQAGVNLETENPESWSLGLDVGTGSFSHSILCETLRFSDQIMDGDPGE